MYDLSIYDNYYSIKTPLDGFSDNKGFKNFNYFISDEFFNRLNLLRFIFEDINITKEQVNNWIKELRSGNYEQCIGRLNRSNKYCCLGIFACMHPNYQQRKDEFVNIDGHTYTGLLCYNDLPLQKLFSHLNDYENYSFHQIADYAEQFFVKYFNYVKEQDNGN